MKIKWDESFMNSSDVEMDKEYIRSEENALNTRLKLDGYLFLNDVLSALGFKRIKRGQLDGWIYDELDAEQNQTIKLKTKVENGELMLILNEEKDIIDNVFNR